MRNLTRPDLTIPPPLPPPPDKPERPPPSERAPQFPSPPRVVTDATLDWHEYVTAVVGSERLLHNQVLGGALQLGWAALTIDDWSPRVSHVSDDMRDRVRVRGQGSPDRPGIDASV